MVAQVQEEVNLMLLIILGVIILWLVAATHIDIFSNLLDYLIQNICDFIDYIDKRFWRIFWYGFGIFLILAGLKYKGIL